MESTTNLMLMVLFCINLFIGAVILYQEVIVNRFRNFATSLFYLVYVPLFLFIPLLTHATLGGARTITAGRDGIHQNPLCYLIYCICTLAVLLPQFFVTIVYPDRETMNRWIVPSRLSHGLFPLGYFVIFCFGFSLYVYATGLSVRELISASRFSWFYTEGHSEPLGATADYFVAVATLVVYSVARLKRGKVLLYVVVTAAFVLYGLCSKDRKWVIYAASGLFGALYFSRGGQFRIGSRAILVGVVVGFTLAFWQVLRDTLFAYMMGETLSFWDEAMTMSMKLVQAGDTSYYYFASMEAIVQNVENSVTIPLGIVRRQLLFFLPAKYSLGLKCEDISALFSDVVFGEDKIRRGNMPPGFYGLFVLSFNWYVAPFFLALVPIALRLIDRFVRTSQSFIREVMLAAGLSSTMMVLRGDDSSATYFIVANSIFTGSLVALLRFMTQSTGEFAAGQTIAGSVVHRGEGEKRFPKQGSTSGVQRHGPRVVGRKPQVVRKKMSNNE